MNPVFKTFNFITRHPLARSHKVRALNNWLSWQIRSRIRENPIEVPYVDSTRLLVSRGMHGATGNIYCGLHEFEDMAFVLHLLGPSDLFVDVGANVGAYTVLASGVCGARTVAVEPVLQSAAALQANIDLNNLHGRVRLEIVALGEKAGTVRVSNSLDCTNHVLTADEATGSESVAMTTLDDLLQGEHPTLLKIDVEGFEMPVLEGSRNVLADPALLGIIIEINGSGQKYGVADTALVEKLIASGFRSYKYDPLERSLQHHSAATATGGNVLFLRNADVVRKRIGTAAQFTVLGQRI